MNSRNAMTEEIVNGIISVLGGKVISVIMYGSFARGTASDDSDIDIAVITD